MRRFLFFVGLLLLSCAARADEPRSIDETIAQVLSNSPEVAIAQANVSYAEAKLRSARWGFFHPELRVSAGDNPLTGATRAGVQVSQDLMRLLTLNGDEVRQTNRDLEVARQRMTIAKNQVIHQVVEVLNRLHLLEDLVQVNAEAVAEQNELLAIAAAQFDVGTGNAEHLLSVRQALLRAQHALRHAEGERWQARIGYSQLLGDPLPTKEDSP